MWSYYSVPKQFEKHSAAKNLMAGRTIFSYVCGRWDPGWASRALRVSSGRNNVILLLDISDRLDTILNISRKLLISCVLLYNLTSLSGKTHKCVRFQQCRYGKDISISSKINYYFYDRLFCFYLFYVYV